MEMLNYSVKERLIIKLALSALKDKNVFPTLLSFPKQLKKKPKNFWQARRIVVEQRILTAVTFWVEVLFTICA